MGSSGLFLISFFPVFLITLISAADPYFQAKCVDNGNFTANSTYGTNLNLLFSQLSTTVDFNYGFYNLSVGRSPDQVNAIGLCRGDQKEDICRSCLNETISELKQRCPNYKEVIGWLEFCTLHYSSQRLFGSMKSSPSAMLYNVKKATNVDEFNQALSPLLTDLSSRAAARESLLKYAADKTIGSLTIYALEQCNPELSQKDCSDCLQMAIERIPSGCYGQIGCRVMQPSCNLRYEMYETRPFFSAVDEIPQPRPVPPPPPPSSSSPSPKEGNANGSSTTRTITIAVVPSVIGILSLNFCVCICLRLRKPREIVQTAEADEMIKADSLQYDLATVRAATCDFSDENKLGQGGFGVVYKGKLPHGQEVAVKRLSSAPRQGDLEFKNEVLLVAKLQHRNLVRLLGFCLEGDERLLIYEFVPNTSLDHFIFAWKNWKEGTGLNLVDPTLRNGLTAEMMRCIHIGLLCVQENVARRPTMASVVLMLSSNSISLPVPSQPAFFMYSTIESDMLSSFGYNSSVSDSKRSKEQSMPWSNNDVSITELYPR